MSDLNIEGAYREVERFAKFFKAFEKIQEVLKFLASSEQLIQEKSLKVQSLTSEIAELEAKRQKTLADLDRDVYDSRIRTEQIIRDYKEQQELCANEIATATVDHNAAIQKLKADFDRAFDTYNEQLVSLKSEIGRHNDILGSIKAQIEKIKSKLE